MPITYILHGGFNSENTETDNNGFYRKVLELSPHNPRVLLVPFAKDDDRIELATAKVTKEFEKVRENRDISVKVAAAKNFIEQVQESDVIYFHGGVSKKLLEALRKYSGLKESLDGKVIAGESAGANVWCQFFYSPHADDIFEGLGFLPIKIIPHYKKEYEGKLDHIKPELQELLLPEYTYKIFTN